MTESATAAGPLAGIRVFDMTLAMVGPWCAMNLGAMGADVIHIEPPTPRQMPGSERPGGGVPPSINGTSIGYISWNMNKRGLTLDMKAQEDRANAYELLKTCDVFLMNMRPDVAGRLGVDYETLSKINPGIVYCTVTGWGQEGPMRELPGADGQINHFTGMSTTNGVEGASEGELYRHSTQMDASTGNYATQAILLALVARKRTGRGQRIDMSMLRATTHLQTGRIGEYLARQTIGPRLGSAAQVVAPDRAFETGDTRQVAVAATSEAEWATFCDVIRKPELKDDPRFATNADRVDHRSELHAILEPVFKEYPLDYWVLQFRRNRLPYGWPMRWDELRYHQQVQDNGYMQLVPSTAPWGDVWTGGPPYRFSKTPERWFTTPQIGEHNDAILRELAEGRGSPTPAPAPTNAREA